MIVRSLDTLLGFKLNAREADRYEQRLNQVATNVSRMAAGIAASLTAVFGIDKLVKAGDAYTTSMNRLGASTKGPEEAAQAFELLYASARETGIAVEESTRGFMRFNPAMGRLGYTMQDTISMLDGLQKGLLAAGSTSAETSSVFQQLGQAINSNVFQGEELGTFLENSSDTLVQTLAQALGTTSDKLKEMGSEGKLTAKNVIPALIAASKAGRDEFGKMRVTVDLASKRTVVAFDYFLAQFDRAFGFTERLARSIEWVGQKLDDWRSYIPTIKSAADEFGGLDQILGAVALGMGALAAAAVVANAPFVLLAGSIALAGALLQDFYKWVQNDGTETLMGELFGPFDQVQANFQPVLDGIKASFLDLKTILTSTMPDEIAAAWERLAARIKAAFAGLWSSALDASGLPDWAKTALGGRATAAPGQAESRANRPWWGPVGTLPPGEAEGSDPVSDYLQRKLRDLTGALGFQQRVQQPDGSMRLLRPGESMSDAMLSRGAPGATTNNVTTTTNAPVNVTVNATGNSGAEVAAGAERGVRQGLEDALASQRVGRDLGVAFPRTEGAYGTGGGF